MERRTPVDRSRAAATAGRDLNLGRSPDFTFTFSYPGAVPTGDRRDRTSKEVKTVPDGTSHEVRLRVRSRVLFGWAMARKL